MIAWGLGQGKFGVQKYGALMAAPSFGGVDLSRLTRTATLMPRNQISVCLP